MDQQLVSSRNSWLRTVPDDEMPAQIKSLGMYQDLYQTSLQANALDNPSGFIVKYYTFINEAFNAFTGAPLASIKAYAEQVGYTGNLNVLVGELITEAIEEVVNIVVGRGVLDTALNKLKVKGTI